VTPAHDSTGGGEHQHPGVAALTHERATHLIAVDPGEVAVEDDDIVTIDGHARQRLDPVEGQVDGHALPAQPLGERGRQPRVIFHNQHPHRCTLTACLSLRNSEVTTVVTMVSPPHLYNWRHTLIGSQKDALR
jgi:hypothetical protein